LLPSAAEICEDKPYNAMSDVWGLGCILYEMATLKRAFEGNSLPALVTKILRGRFSPIPSRYSVHLRSLIHSMLARNPKRRPTVEAILKLPWMRR
jgi:serine/threonine protein kinase